MKVFEHAGKYYVSYEDELRRGIIPDLNEVSNWCRAMWGDTDHRTNPDYKWRRRMFEFSFSREGHRDLFLLEFGNRNKEAA
jgi:hypothetical protein